MECGELAPGNQENWPDIDMNRLCCDWTLGHAGEVYKASAASRTIHKKREQKLVQEITAKALTDHKFQEAVVLAANTDLPSFWFDAAEHGEGCRGAFLVDRSRSTHSQKI